MPDRAARLHAALTAALTPSEVRVVDDSASHAGHAGAAVGGETHYSVVVVSDRFAGLSRLARHRLVNAAAAAEFGTRLHALTVVARTPAEGGS